MILGGGGGGGGTFLYMECIQNYITAFKVPCLWALFSYIIPVLVFSCGAKFSIVIVTEQFEGKRLLERHRMVNGAVAEEMKEIHVLFITKAVTPEQWKQQQESEKSQAAA
ncbi:hypothetical protein RND71_014754 [Anisodus tanguticus]|uniref:Uncharacterized protein n=1 Tax=Anisodus tanguticus TaxID=243964 RepID=A0AAE1SC79_9SOLA|nr:hypothetical protein RND71_014754 [Anisodus tanguticus]